MKKILALMLALVMCFAMVACGEKAPADEPIVDDAIVDIEGEGEEVVDGEEAIEGEDAVVEGEEAVEEEAAE